MAFKVTPDVQEAMDYIDLKTYRVYDDLCGEGYLERDITSIPIVKFSRALHARLGVCSRTCRFSKKDDIVHTVDSYITYNLLFIERNIYEPEFWERLDETIIHEVSHLTLEHPTASGILQIGRFYDKHGPKWKEAMQFLGIEDPQRLAEFDEYTEKLRDFAYICPVCGSRHVVFSKPPRGKSYVCPTCREKGIKTLIRKELVQRVK